MTAKQTDKPDKRQRAGYLAALFAVLTCPCHIPIYVMLLSGTAAGTILAENRSIAIGLFSLLFLLFVFSTMRLLKSRKQEA